MLKNIRYALALLTVVATGAAAQQYPGKPAHIVAPYAAGGSVDVVGRMVAKGLSEALGQPFIVENRTGASGNIAANYVAKAPKDGHTLLVHNAASVASNISAYKSLPFNPRTDFIPLALVARQPGVLVVRPSLPVKNVAEFIAYANANPGKMNYGVGGVFGPTSTPAVLFSMKTGAQAVAVMYKGTVPAMADLLGGQIDFMFDVVPTSLPHIKTNKLRALAVTSAHRLPQLPDVPTIQEAGVKGYEYNSWIGLSAPAGTPPEVVSRLNAAINSLLSQEGFRKGLTDQGLEVPDPVTVKEFRAFVDREIEFYAEIVKASGIPPAE